MYSQTSSLIIVIDYWIIKKTCFLRILKLNGRLLAFAYRFICALTDRFALGLNPYSPDAPRPYRQALCKP
jgi:hypothetical protein